MLTLENTSYGIVGPEYYDPVAHPTCASFRVACLKLFSTYSELNDLFGKVVCDIGAGKSIVAEYFKGKRRGPSSIDIIDRNPEMLTHSNQFDHHNIQMIVHDATKPYQKRPKYHFIAAILADPFNTAEAWQAAHAALLDGGELLFVTPSWSWASSFRSRASREQNDAARFLLKNGKEIYLPSFIYSKQLQLEMFEEAGFELIQILEVDRSEVGYIPPKFMHLDDKCPIITGYRLRKKLQCSKKINATKKKY